MDDRYSKKTNTSVNRHCSICPGGTIHTRRCSMQCYLSQGKKKMHTASRSVGNVRLINDSYKHLMQPFGMKHSE